MLGDDVSFPEAVMKSSPYELRCVERLTVRIRINFFALSIGAAHIKLKSLSTAQHLLLSCKILIAYLIAYYRSRDGGWKRNPDR